MTCPHCGADAPADKKFCPSCSRLVDSPLLKMKQQLEAMRAEHSILRKSPLSGRPVPPPPHSHTDLGGPTFQAPTFHSPSGPPNAPPDVPASGQTRDELAEEAWSRRQRKKKSTGINRPQPGQGSGASHSATNHRFDPTGASTHHQQTTQTAQSAEGASSVVPESFKRPAAMTVYAILDVFAAIALFRIAAALHESYPEPRVPLIQGGIYVLAGLGLLFALAAIGMWKLWPIGRSLQRLLAFPFLFSPPLGTGFALFTLVFLATPANKLLFSGKAPRQLAPKELKAVLGSQKLSPAIALLLFIFSWAPALAAARFVSHDLPWVLELATQHFPALGSLPSNEPAVEAGGPAAADAEQGALEDVGMLMRGQAAYASLNSGLYDRVECIVAPQHCIRNDDPRNVAKLLDQRFTQMERNGYLFQLRLTDLPESRPPTASANGMGGYSYRAVPIGGKGKAFCGDHTGMVCTFDPENVSGDPLRCPDGCTPIEPPAPVAVP